MRSTFMIIVVWLAGCATPESDLRNRPPSLELASRHSAVGVATCISARWKRATAFDPSGGYPIEMNQVEGGYTVSALASKAFDVWSGALAYVENTTDGSATQYFENGVSTEEAFDNAVKECQ